MERESRNWESMSWRKERNFVQKVEVRRERILEVELSWSGRIANAACLGEKPFACDIDPRVPLANVNARHRTILQPVSSSLDEVPVNPSLPDFQSQSAASMPGRQRREQHPVLVQRQG